MSEWVKDNGIYYYYYSDGTMATGWQELDGYWYYFYSDGSMAYDTMVEGYYVNDDGQWTKDEGSKEIIDGHGDHFYYYIGPNNGKAVTGWNKIGDTFHYYNYPYGSMKRNDTQDGFDIDNYGNIVDGTGWIEDEYSGKWYYFSDGEMKSNDTEDGYHVDNSGKMVTGTGWKYVDSWWYYLDDTGKVVTGWLYDQGNWYYLYPQGSMAKDTTIDGYYLNDDGDWVPNANTGWMKIGDDWYYFNDNGEKLTNTWIPSSEGNNWYYVDSDGKMKTTDYVEYGNGRKVYFHQDGTAFEFDYDGGDAQEDDDVTNGIMLVSGAGDLIAVGAKIGKAVIGGVVKTAIKNAGKDAAKDASEAAIKDAGEDAAKGVSNPTGTGTVWDNIVGTAESMPATEIPATFQIKLGEGISYVNPTTGSNVLWTNANATEHMGEYVSRFGEESWSIDVRSQAMLESYSSSLNKAMEELATQPPGRYFETYGNWELGINTETGVVYHAKMLY